MMSFSPNFSALYVYTCTWLNSLIIINGDWWMKRGWINLNYSYETWDYDSFPVLSLLKSESRASWEYFEKTVSFIQVIKSTRSNTCNKRSPHWAAMYNFQPRIRNSQKISPSWLRNCHNYSDVEFPKRHAPVAGRSRKAVEFHFHSIQAKQCTPISVCPLLVPILFPFPRRTSTCRGQRGLAPRTINDYDYGLTRPFSGNSRELGCRASSTGFSHLTSSGKHSSRMDCSAHGLLALVC